MIQLHVAKGCGPTGKILRELLLKNGVTFGPNGGHVCWGAATQAKPALNGHIVLNKLEELLTLGKAGIRTVPVFQAGRPFHMPYPVLARKLKHVGGRDIFYCRDAKRAGIALKRECAYFTQYIPSTTEYRVWIYRKRHLGTYEKILAHPEWKHRMVGRNYKNGYAFSLIQEANIPRDAVEQATRSITALGLDFGAVDILRGKDGNSYVLEVNTAPGVEGSNRQVIQSLAKRITRWDELKFPGRSEDSNNAV